MVLTYMHQTFYIDIDEEITSVIEKLRKSQAKEVIIVVPKRALLIQSIVNLRLLKKEADSMGLAVMVVTQDKLGKLLVEKAGILVQQKLDDESGEMVESTGKKLVGENAYLNPEGADAFLSSPGRMKNLGSADFYEGEASMKRLEVPSEEFMVRETEQNVVDVDAQKQPEKILNKELVMGIGSDIRRKKTTEPAKNVIQDDSSDDFSSEEQLLSQEKKNQAFFPGNFNDKKIENFFQHLEAPIDERTMVSSKRAYRKTLGFLAVLFGLACLGALGYGLYVYLPKATVVLTTKSKAKAVDSEIRGDVNFSAIDYEKEIIPAKAVSVNEEVSKTFSASGKKSVSNQKAKGTITIYNEYSSDSQPLVATTRFLSESNKLFRLVKGVTVPGATKVGAETKPGVIEAEVMADESGDSFNIAPSNFSIPGFKDSGNEKYTKIYAKSTAAMTGGGSGSQEAKVITEGDLNVAKSKVASELNELVKNKIKESAGEGWVVLGEAIQMEEATYKTSSSAGEIADNFSLTAEIKAEAVVFSESDIKNVVNKVIARSGDGKTDINGKSVSLEYGKPDVNFKTGIITIKVHGAGKLNPNINVSNLKKEILGKTNDELGEYLSGFPDVEKVEVLYWPSFINKKIPLKEGRVEVVLEN